MKSPYVDLHSHSTFSCAMTAGDAVGSVQEMVDRAVKLGWSAVALTDHGWLGGAPALYKAAREAGIKPIIGCELYVTPDFLHGVRGKEADGNTFHLTVLALSKEGYENLVAWTTEAMQRDNYHRKPRISLFRMAEIAPHDLSHNVVLSGCLASELCRTVAESNGSGIPLGIAYVQQMKQLFPNFYIELVDHEIEKRMDEDLYPAYVALIAREAEVRAKLLEIAKATGTNVVLTNDSHMPTSQHRTNHMALKSSGWRNRDDVHYTASDARIMEAFRPDYTYYGNYMRNLEVIVDRGNIPPAALESVGAIVEECDIRLEPLDKFQYSLPPSGRDDPVKAIRKRCVHRLQTLIERHGEEARVRFEHELESMASFADYLLLMSDFIRKAKKQGILTWTRGSAANSLLCYCLEIHEIDSIEYGLIFSRFFNPARKKLPDIDVDIQPSRYNDFMQIVHEEMEPLVGKGQIVQISNWGTAANRKAFRLAASALGMPKEEQDEISKLLPQMIDSGMIDEDTDIFMALREDYPELYEIASGIFDSITSVSQHACAWVFGTPERPVAEWIPLYLIASSGTLVTQYDFKTLEDFGLTKMDFLRLKTLDIAATTLKAAGKSPLDFHEIPLDDEEVFEMIRAGHVDGVHTLQGKETRKGVMEVGVKDVHDLILCAALYRPANTREDKHVLYNQRRRGDDDVEYEHEILENILSPTLGIPVFQEQAMEIVYEAGGDDAFVDDVYQGIKKAKGAGRGAKEIFDALQPDFIRRAKKHLGISSDMAETIWDYVKSFQGYGFNKGHATSYGLLGYLIAYLKWHHPAEYFAALLSVFPERGNYIAAARAEGYKLLPPDVNRPSRGWSLDKIEGGIRAGIDKVFKIGPGGATEIIDNAPFTDYDDFVARTRRRSVNVRALENLRRVGAMGSLGIRGGDTDRDRTEFEILGLCLNKPKAIRGCKPKHVGERTSSSGWRHLGLQRGIEFSDSRSSVSKLFWIPPESKFELKASPWANVKCHLLEVVDENGVPMHLMVNENKEAEAKLITFLANKCRGCVICADGMIRLPFIQNGLTGFRFFGITGAYNQDPQIWHLPKKKEKKFKRGIVALDEMKRRSR
jgi:DNA polymerase III subunit alpha